MSLRLSLRDYAKRRTRIAAFALGNSVDPFGEDSPWFVPVDRFRAEVEARSQRFVNFGHYDYMGLGGHDEVRGAARNALDEVGVGALGSRLTGGERAVHHALEAELADFAGTESAIATVSGYLTSYTLIPHLCGADDLIVMDELIHSCGSAGARASRATMKTFRHNDLDHLEDILRQSRERHGLCVILVEGLYSMDGDIPDLPALLRLRDRYGAWLVIDEAHSFGPLGRTGRGLCEHWGVEPGEVDIILGTLSKTFVSMGGFICASRPVIDWLRYTLPGFVFSVGLSPVIAATALSALRILRREPWRADVLRQRTRTFLDLGAAAGLDVGDAGGFGIVPVLFPGPGTAFEAARRLADAGIYAPPIPPTGASTGTSRIRFFISAATEPADIARTVEVLASAPAEASPTGAISAGTRI